MGRIKHRGSVWTDVIDDVVKAPVTNGWMQGAKNVGILLETATQIYENPMLKDAAAGIVDMFSGDQASATKGLNIVKAANNAEELKSQKESETTDMYKAAQSRISPSRAGAVEEYQQRIDMPDPVEELDIGIQTDQAGQSGTMYELPSSDETGGPTITSLNFSTPEGVKLLFAHAKRLGVIGDPRKEVRLVNNMDQPTALRTLNSMQGRVGPRGSQFFYDLLYAKAGFDVPNVVKEAPQMETPILMEQRSGLPLQGATPPKLSRTPVIPLLTDEAVDTTSVPVEAPVAPTQAPMEFPSVIQSGPVASLTKDQKNAEIQQGVSRVLTDFNTGAGNITAGLNEVRQRLSDPTLGNTPQDVEATMRSIAEILSGTSSPTAAPVDNIQVPNIGGMSIQEAEGVAMEIAASSGSMASKQKAMRLLIGQAGDIDDVVPAWMARGGTLGYLDRDMAADRLRKAFTGMMPKPKAAKAMSTGEALKVMSHGQKEKQSQIKTDTMLVKRDAAREKLAKQYMMTGIEIRDELWDEFLAAAKLDDDYYKKTGKKSSDGGAASNQKLETYRKETMRTGDSDRKFAESKAAQLQSKADAFQKIGLAEFKELSPNDIAKNYGPNLQKYLDDVRNAADDKAASAILAKAKSALKNTNLTRAKKYRDIAKKLSKITGALRDAGLIKNRKTKEKLLREYNRLVQELQKED